MFLVNSDGSLSQPTITPDPIPGVFDVVFSPDGAALIVQTGSVTTNASSVSSYLVEQGACYWKCSNPWRVRLLDGAHSQRTVCICLQYPQFLDLWFRYRRLGYCERSRYQQADPGAAAALVVMLSPQLYRFLDGKMGSRTDAEYMLQDVWLRVHRVRHAYRPSELLLQWVYAIARRVRVDNYRKRQRIASREIAAVVLPEAPTQKNEVKTDLPSFENLVASLPERQREVLTMLKVNEVSLEEVARATSSTVGAVKQKAHRAYQQLRNLLEQHQFAQAAPKGEAR